MREQREQSTLRDVQGVPSAGAFRWVPPLIGALAAGVAFQVGGHAAAAWLVGGVFLGGFVPFYLMPWLRRSRR